jgi:glyoxylase-like metal-dependent hydrolase (beta-lactamase superfamily II)
VTLGEGEHHHGEHYGGASYWDQWTAPPTVITLLVAAVTLYGSHVIQAERLDIMRGRVEAIERDYQRRDVLAEQLRSIDTRLGVIEASVGAKRPAGQP